MFTINQLEQYSGIKSHTLRIWEKRYNALKPHRSKGNIRYYDDNQLKKLFNIVNLLHANYKISTICSMSPQEILEKNEKLIIDHDKNIGFYINKLIEYGMNLQEIEFQKIYKSAIQKFNLIETYIQIIYPMLHKIGLLWLSEKLPPVQEHFISNLIRNNILQAINKIKNVPVHTADSPWILFLPENEYHEIGLLIAYYLIKKKGFPVYYLGANLSFECLQLLSLKNKKIHYVCFLIQSNNVHKFNTSLLKFTQQNKNCVFHLIGNATVLNDIKKNQKIQIHSNIQSFQSILI